MLLTAIQIKYIRVLHRLQDVQSVKLADVAEVLHVSKPSVHNMFQKLKRFGLIVQDEKGYSRLTELGKETARRYEEEYTILFSFLTEILHVEKEIAQENAIALMGSENCGAQDLCHSIEQFREKIA